MLDLKLFSEAVISLSVHLKLPAVCSNVFNRHHPNKKSEMNE